MAVALTYSPGTGLAAPQSQRRKLIQASSEESSGIVGMPCCCFYKSPVDAAPGMLKYRCEAGCSPSIMTNLPALAVFATA